jgi:hypothetical protein
VRTLVFDHEERRASGARQSGVGCSDASRNSPGSCRCIPECLWLERSVAQSTRLRQLGANERRDRRRWDEKAGERSPDAPAGWALDHATGYLMAAAVVRGLAQRIITGQGFEARASLARTAQLLVSGPAGGATGDLTSTAEADWSEAIEATQFGPALRLRSAVTIGDTPMHWDRPAVKLGSSAPAW